MKGGDPLKKNKFAKRLRFLRKQKGMTQKDIAKIVGTTDNAIGNYERGSRMPDAEMLIKIANIFKVNIDFLLGNTDNPYALKYAIDKEKNPITSELLKRLSTENRAIVIENLKDAAFASNAAPAEMVMLPILGEIRAGKPLFAEEHIKGKMPFPKEMLTSGYEHFLLKVDGDSMIGDGIEPNDIVLIRVQNYIDYNNQIAAVIINGCEACIKHVVHPKNSEMAILRSSNPKYEDIIYPANELIINGVYAGVFKAPKS